jgi:hypothetical protein
VRKTQDLARVAATIVVAPGALVGLEGGLRRAGELVAVGIPALAEGFLPGLAMGVVLGTAVTAIAAVKTYQYTGVVTEANAKEIKVDKCGDVWEFAVDGDTKGTLDAKKGDKVTVTYRMFATKIEKKWPALSRAGGAASAPVPIVGMRSGRRALDADPPPAPLTRERPSTHPRVPCEPVCA